MYTYRIDDDYNVIIISPTNEQKYLHGVDKQYFLVGVEQLEESGSEVNKKISDLIANYYW